MVPAKSKGVKISEDAVINREPTMNTDLFAEKRVRRMSTKIMAPGQSGDPEDGVSAPVPQKATAEQLEQTLRDTAGA